MSFLHACSGCGKKFPFGGMGSHVRYDRSCTPEKRFWGKVIKGRPDECWPFSGAVNTTGYGMVSWDGKKNIVASRLAWTLVNGPIPAGMSVLHKCDVRRCCNVRHMFLGTYADNAADKVAKGRQRPGEQSATAKLTEAQAKTILREYRCSPNRKDSNVRELAARFGVRPATITAVVSGRSWPHLERNRP